MIPVEDIPKYYKTGILIDTNLLILLLVGSIDTNLIANFDSTKSRQYSKKDFEAFNSLVGKFSRILITPNILTETTYFIDKSLGKNLTTLYCEILNDALGKNVHEEYAAGKDIVKEKMFLKFGLTDASILVASKKEKCLVITDDLRLYAYLYNENIATINFTQFRPLYL